MAELVIPGQIVGGEIVVIVLTVVDRVCAGVQIVAVLIPAVGDANVGRRLGGRPRRGFAASREADLRGPVISPFGGGVDAGLGVAIVNVSQRMRVCIVIRGQLRLDIRKRHITAHSDIGAFTDVGEYRSTYIMTGS